MAAPIDDRSTVFETGIRHQLQNEMLIGILRGGAMPRHLIDESHLIDENRIGRDMLGIFSR